MIICTKCGFQNPDSAAFCASCGSFLEWTGAKVPGAPPAPPPTETAPPAPTPDSRAGLITQARRALGLEGGLEGGAAAASPALPPVPARVAPEIERIEVGAAGPVVEPVPPRVAPQPAAAAQAPTAGIAEPSARFPALPVAPPPAAPAPVLEASAPVQPDAVKPGLARPRPLPAAPASVETPPGPGDVVCPSCGIANDPTRRFCRRCGMSMAPVVPAGRRPPWWRRILSRRRAAVAAGERPTSVQRRAAAAAGARGSGVRRALGLILAALVAAGVAGFVFVPSVRQAVTDQVNQIRIQIAPNYVLVHTVGHADGPSISGHDPQQAFDGFTNTYWSAPASATQPTIAAAFSPPADIAKVMIKTGDFDDFQAQPRPRTVRLEFLGPGGNVLFSGQFELQDDPGFQTLDVGSRGATSFTLTVLSVYQSNGGDSVSIAEIEFWART
jgi:hypothetical protein